MLTRKFNSKSVSGLTLLNETIFIDPKSDSIPKQLVKELYAGETEIIFISRNALQYELSRLGAGNLE